MEEAAKTQNGSYSYLCNPVSMQATIFIVVIRASNHYTSVPHRKVYYMHVTNFYFSAFCNINFVPNVTKILPLNILPCASTNPASAFSPYPSYKDTARQVSKPCRACPLFVKHRIPVNFRSSISICGRRVSICPPQEIFPCITRSSSHGPPAANSVPPGCFWPPGPLGRRGLSSGVLPRGSKAWGRSRCGAAGSRTGR